MVAGESVVALAPAGGWIAGDPALPRTLALFTEWQVAFRALAPHSDAVARSPEGRRRVTSALTVEHEHLPPELVVDIMNATAFCPGTQPLIDTALREGDGLDAERITCPVRIVWGTADTLLPWPSTAARYRHEWLPHAEWIELDGVGHCPQLDVPVEAVQLISGSRRADARPPLRQSPRRWRGFGVRCEGSYGGSQPSVLRGRGAQGASRSRRATTRPKGATVARKRPNASDVQQMLSEFDAGNAEDVVSAGAEPGAEASLSPAQMHALRRSDRLTSAECVAHRERAAADPLRPKSRPS